MTVILVEFVQRATCDCGWVSRLPDRRAGVLAKQWSTLELGGHRAATAEHGYIHLPIWAMVLGVGLTTARGLQQMEAMAGAAPPTPSAAAKREIRRTWRWLAFRGWGWVPTTGEDVAFPVGGRYSLTGGVSGP